AQPLAIPASFSTDPRNGFTVTTGQTVPRVGTTAMPDFIGLGAANDAKLTRQLADIVRQEYRAMGFQIALSPQADLATEPRWTRINGTFGADTSTVRKQVEAFVEGMQAGDDGLTTSSVATVTKHWAGYGAADQGFDSHYYYGRYATFPGDNFAEHLKPYKGAFAAKTSGIMPTYSILKDLVYRGQPVEQVGVAYSRYMLTDLLRGKYGFDGVIVSDWAITGNCPQECQAVRPPARFVGPWGVGMPWGVEDLTRAERFAKAINAGVDQLGGSDEPQFIIDALNQNLLTQQRVDESARRVLIQKFQLGLFENPYADPDAAAAIAGNASFTAIGDTAQAKSLTLLKNNARLLPLSKKKTQKVYLSGVSASVAEARGLTVVTNPADADLAIVRLSDPRSGPDLTGLDFTGTEADYMAFRAAVDSGVTTVAVPKLDRPLILTGVIADADAVLANYGVSDEVLLDTLYGTRAPGGRLPFELPSSMAAVEAQNGDVADDSVDPLYKRGFGLSYRGSTHHSKS
ncbi:MAG: glycoside hydrolase family 3 N-terminal domain-containing protein, partial [Propionicimonas sp.]